MSKTMKSGVKEFYEEIHSESSGGKKCLWRALNLGSETFGIFALKQSEFRDLFRKDVQSECYFGINHYTAHVFPFYSCNLDPRNWYGIGTDTVLQGNKTAEVGPSDDFKSYLRLLAKVCIENYTKKALEYGYFYPGIINAGSRAEISIPSEVYGYLREAFLAIETEVDVVVLSEREYSKLAEDPYQKIDDNSVYLVLGD